MADRPQQSPSSRFYLGLLALGAAVACGIWIPELEGRPSLVHSKYSEVIFLFVVLPLLFIAVRGVTTGKNPAPGAKEEVAEIKERGLHNRLKLGCAAFLIAPMGSGLVGLLCASSPQVHPLDRESMIATFAGLGFIAGCVVAVFIMLSSIGE